VKEANFHDFKDFDDFEALFHQIFVESRYLGFTKSGVIFAHALNALPLKYLDFRFLLAGSSVLSTPSYFLRIDFDLMLVGCCLWYGTASYEFEHYVNEC
jgi:hypothetical protein